ncbi:MAG: hypothetical protein ACKVU0_04810 [Saprospiraceae bacterium]
MKNLLQLLISFFLGLIWLFSCKDKSPEWIDENMLPDRVPLWDEQPEFVTFGWFSGDAKIADYRQLIDSTFLLNIEHLDILTGDISGTYSGVFVKEFPLEQIGGPDTVGIEQGVFKTKISKPKQ